MLPNSRTVALMRLVLPRGVEMESSGDLLRNDRFLSTIEKSDASADQRQQLDKTLAARF